MNIFAKIKFILKKPRIVVLLGQKDKETKMALLKVLKNYFKISKDLFIFEAEEKNLNKFSFFLKNSKLPILTLIDFDQLDSLLKKIPLQTFFVLNCQNLKIKENINTFNNFKNIKFGFDEKNDLFVSDIKINQGTTFKVNYRGSIVPFRFEKKLDEKQLNNLLSIIAVSLVLKLNLVTISQFFNFLDINQKKS